MTPQQALTIIEASVKEACPELFERNLGLKYRNKITGATFTLVAIYNGDPLYIDMSRGFPQLTMISGWANEKIIKILGHDITLEHVLKAIHSECEIHHEPQFIQFRIKTHPEYSKDWIVWSLGKPLHEQSDPCKLFLAEIFGK